MENHINIPNKFKVTMFFKSLQLLDVSKVEWIQREKYIEHHQHPGVGIERLVNDYKTYADHFKISVVRIFEDGEYVFTHSEYRLAPVQVVFDVFRFEKGLIVEHWDNLQPLGLPNASGHTMLDGPVKASGWRHTEANKVLSRNLIDDILVNGRFEKLGGYYDGDNYIQHNPWFPDKVSGLLGALNKWAVTGISMKYSRIHQVLGEGNFVLVISEGHLANVHSSFYDLFRVENGLIAEHWDTIQEITAPDFFQNDPGKFNFG